MPGEVPGWVRRLADEHAVLHRLAQQMEYLITSPDAVSVGNIVPILEEIAARCRAQKVYEEREDYLPSLIADHPELADAIRPLLLEHTKLHADITELIAAVQRQTTSHNMEKQLVPQIQLWLNRIAEHQRRVNSVVEEVFPAPE